MRSPSALRKFMRCSWRVSRLALVFRFLCSLPGCVRMPPCPPLGFSPGPRIGRTCVANVSCFVSACVCMPCAVPTGVKVKHRGFRRACWGCGTPMPGFLPRLHLHTCRGRWYTGHAFTTVAPRLPGLRRAERGCGAPTVVVPRRGYVYIPGSLVYRSRPSKVAPRLPGLRRA